MAFIIPNATDTASGAKYENLDQAEPDSLDFEILGNAGRSGVLSGCEVTALSASNTAVSVSGGVIVLNGQPYIVSGQSSFGLPTAPTDVRFDLVVARVSGGSASLVTVQGNDELTNPEFPQSANTLASGVVFDGSVHVDLSTDVVLASVYRQGSQNITAGCIVDRRLLTATSIPNQGTTAPSASTGYVGNLYYRNNVISGTTASGVYVKNSLGTWIELAQNNGPQVPVGSIISWLGTSATVPEGYLECNGQTVSRTTYAYLFDVIGTAYGAGDGSTTFSLPNFNGKHLKGTINTGTVGTNTGSDTYTLNTAQLPSHLHDISHTHTVSHDHTAVHNHTANTGNTGTHYHTADGNLGAVSAGNHNHSSGNYDADTGGSHAHQISGYENDTQVQFVRRRAGYSNTNLRAIDVDYDTTTFGMAVDSITSTTNHGGHGHTISGNSGNTGAHSHDVSGNTANSGSHSHTASVDSSNTNTGVATPTTGSISTTNSGNTGSGSSINNVPSSVYARWLIRATGTVNNTAEDAAEILSEAREEVVTVELVGATTLPASQTDAAYYRMPWAATLTAVKANRNGTNSNGSVTIDVNEGGTSVLSTEITIDVSESSSLDAATPAVISDSALANDALLTFDIDSANTSDEGPLTVTLYFTRED